ncbi:type IV pilus assembly protein PilM [Curtobacterium sp. VKM Ac-2922]|uniref:type IV pilus assembly protein PilM n=1 Tax=Curtobacterium sp. VKM Ac-2922 TaxID=2929475 RepID=UPI001FB40796|nr:type IV pilus assembly protein PilM [Curtobacterium sp. VKM Ac-2922]MCJ1715664.1 type IV pilus assembly protein PilM [Curtobacterium sp. VKM Ac-2922]
MAKSIVGLDLTGTSIRGVEVADPDKARPRVLRVAEVPAPPGAISRGEVLEPNTVAQAIRTLWRTGRFRSRRVVLGMGNQRVLARDLTVPQVPAQQMRESLPFQVQDMLPVPVGDAILDFLPTSAGAGDNGPTVSGLLIAAVKDAVLANVRAVQLAGLTPAGVDLIPFALSRSLITRRRIPGTIALIELGADTTSVVILTDGTPQFVRIIPSGGNDVTKALSGRLEIPIDEAESVKQWFGIGREALTPDDARALAITTEAVGELLSSLRNTVKYFVNTRPENPVDSIVLTGGGSLMSGFAAALSGQTGLAVEQGDAFADALFARTIDADDIALRRESVTVAYGLAVGSRAA